jgi:hypothetical protein
MGYLAETWHISVRHPITKPEGAGSVAYRGLEVTPMPNDREDYEAMRFEDLTEDALQQDACEQYREDFEQEDDFEEEDREPSDYDEFLEAQL